MAEQDASGLPEQPERPSLSPAEIELFHKYLDAQKSQFEVKRQELELEAHRIHIEGKDSEHNAEIAKIAIDAQSKDRVGDRDFRLARLKALSMLSLLLCLPAAALAAYALHLGKDQIVLEAIKAIIFFGAGGLGGYAWGSKKRLESAQTEEEEE